MCQTISTSDVVIELPYAIVEKVYKDISLQVTNKQHEPASLEIEGIITIPNVLQLINVSYDTGSVQFSAPGMMRMEVSGNATLTLRVLRLFPNL
ncbi:hypothetical protein HOU08_gp155 [Dickeya phage vB_DsoM_JA29]|uniref:Uncharacterized protein n=1 Tax=Dickeya phage vB_DsoM_JA29 TaxID=2283031 RepID=A0A384ZXB8_9CAUD|nr:hypothetical protein HOU08_gp155 [Dickeya phage vB_DsoM_JA29]AXG66881.1 hypothetical protein JA29_155 [Dickeya phage vB_DsoM_JA29]